MRTIAFITLLVLVAGFAVAAGVDPNWDKSSYTFNESEVSCEAILATFCSTSDKDAQGTTTYEVYYSETGDPKEGDVVYNGEFPALMAEECFQVSYTPEADGNYAIKLYQRPGHPGIGHLWSDMMEYEECPPVPEFGTLAVLAAGLGGLAILVTRRH
jgi:YqxM protein